MPELQEVAGRIAGLIALFGFVPYIVSILRGHTRPNRATWWIWSVVGGVLCASYYSAGAGEAIWVPISYVIGPLATALLSLKYGEGGWSRFDRLCLLGSGLSLALWAISGSPILALTLNIGIDLFGALPTVLKAWREPESEDLLAWSVFLCGNTLNLFAIQSWSYDSAAYPAYLFAVAATITALLARPKLHRLALGQPQRASTRVFKATDESTPGLT